MFNFGYNVLHASLIDLAEDCVIAYHAALAYFAMVFDVKHLESAWILIDVVYWAFLSAYYPIDVHLKEYVSGIGVG